ncbi:MAG TPA: 2-C-methyl-D-erythritol 4-phosphate cytidylyltransferase [Actinocrinis sp.]
MHKAVRARVAAIVPAAGRGERLGGGAPKALRRIGGIPILVHAVAALLDSGRVGLVVVAAPPGGEDEVAGLLEEFEPHVRVVAGGTTRQRSVALALAAIPEQTEVVLVHDAARALTPPSVIAAVADAVTGSGDGGADAVIPVLPVADTIKAVDRDGLLVTGTVDRSGLRAVQTPQGFRRSVLALAHEKAGAPADEAAAATDDAGLVERLGLPVAVVPGHAEAFKVTTPFDLIIAEAVYAARRPVAAADVVEESADV